MSDEICAELDRVPSIEPDTIFAPNPTIAAADKEPLISVAICAELDTTLVPVKGNLICFDLNLPFFSFCFSLLINIYELNLPNPMTSSSLSNEYPNSLVSNLNSKFVDVF